MYAASLEPASYSSTKFTDRQATSNSNANRINQTGAGLSAKFRPASNLQECGAQQVCNAIFVRMNHTQKLCDCSSNYNWKCSNNIDAQDGHTIELTRKFDKRVSCALLDVC